LYSCVNGYSLLIVRKVAIIYDWDLNIHIDVATIRYDLFSSFS
jgi:hypothetical protein